MRKSNSHMNTALWFSTVLDRVSNESALRRWHPTSHMWGTLGLGTETVLLVSSNLWKEMYEVRVKVSSKTSKAKRVPTELPYCNADQGLFTAQLYRGTLIKSSHLHTETSKTHTGFFSLKRITARDPHVLNC